MREKIYTPLSVESAVDARYTLQNTFSSYLHFAILFSLHFKYVFFYSNYRDAVAKILYSLLFQWLTERINGRVYPRNEALSISLLDIYGFEVYSDTPEHTYKHIFDTCITFKVKCAGFSFLEFRSF